MSREFGIAAERDGVERWSVEHLFLGATPGPSDAIASGFDDSQLDRFRTFPLEAIIEPDKRDRFLVEIDLPRAC